MTPFKPDPPLPLAWQIEAAQAWLHAKLPTVGLSIEPAPWVESLARLLAEVYAAGQADGPVP